MSRIANKNLKKLLTERKITQTELSKLTHIPISTINDYVKNKHDISYENLKKITQVLKVSIMDIISDWQSIIIHTHTFENKTLENRIFSMNQLHLLKLTKEDKIVTEINFIKESVVFMTYPNYQLTDIVIAKNEQEDFVYVGYYKQLKDKMILGKVIGQFITNIQE